MDAHFENQSVDLEQAKGGFDQPFTSNFDLLSEVGAKRSAANVFETNEHPEAPKAKRKKKNDNQAKRHKYDILQAFFRIYFVKDMDSAVAKEAIFNLYLRKIPSELTIARNAMYRHMWSFYGKEISTSQSNYREYIKGLKMVTDSSRFYEEIEKDVGLLQGVGVNNLFDFKLEDLLQKSKEPSVVEPPPSLRSTDISPIISSSNVLPIHVEDENLYTYVESLEAQAINLAQALKHLKERLQPK